MLRSIYVPKGGFNYIVGSVDINGNYRPSKILRGDLNAVLNALAFADKKKYKNPFVVITYRDPTPLEELGGMEFLEKFMDDIEELRFPRLKKNQFAYFFALHENIDGSTELNLFIANVANERQIAAYVDRRDFAADCIFSEMIHAKYPKLVNPNAIENRRILSPHPRWDKHQLDLFNEVKASVCTLCEDKDFIKNYNKNLLKTSLTGNGFTLEEDSQSRIFVKNDNAKIRLKGNLLKEDFNLSKYISGTENPRKYKLSAAERLEISNDKRSKIFLEKHKHLEKESEYERNIRELKSKINRAISVESEGVNNGDGEGRSSESTSGLEYQRDGQEDCEATTSGAKNQSNGRGGSSDADSVNTKQKQGEYGIGREISRVSNNSEDREDTSPIKAEKEEKLEPSFIEDLFLGITNSLEPWLEELKHKVEETKAKAKLEAEAKAKALLKAKRAAEAKSEAKARFEARVAAAQVQNRQNDASIKLVSENMKHLISLKGNVSQGVLRQLQNVAIFYAASNISVVDAFKGKNFNEIYSDYNSNLNNKTHNNNQGYER